MNKFNSHKQFETHALKKVIGRKFYLNNIKDDGQVGKIAEEKLFGKVVNITKSQTVPQIFMDVEFVGGAEDLESKLYGDTEK